MTAHIITIERKTDLKNTPFKRSLKWRCVGWQWPAKVLAGTTNSCLTLYSQYAELRWWFAAGRLVVMLVFDHPMNTPLRWLMSKSQKVKGKTSIPEQPRAIATAQIPCVSVCLVSLCQYPSKTEPPDHWHYIILRFVVPFVSALSLNAPLQVVTITIHLNLCLWWHRHILTRVVEHRVSARLRILVTFLFHVVLDYFYSISPCLLDATSGGFSIAPPLTCPSAGLLPIPRDDSLPVSFHIP